MVWYYRKVNILYRMGDGNYSLDLSPFFLYNRDTDNVGKQSFNDCYGQLTNVDDVLIVAFFDVSNYGCTTACLPSLIESISVSISSLVSSIIITAITNLLLTKLSLEKAFTPLLRFPASYRSLFRLFSSSL